MEINTAKMKVRLTFAEAILGTWPSDPEIASRFIASKSPDAITIEEEIAALGADKVEERSRTVFPKLPDGTPFVYDYQIKGLFKDCCGMLNRVDGTKSKGLKAYKKVIDGLIFVCERTIPIRGFAEIGNCQRPLRAQTMQGERVSLANSEEIPAGAYIEFTVECLDKKHMELVREWFDYGILRGFGQWRNSGKGRYYWQELDDNGNVIGGNMPETA